MEEPKQDQTGAPPEEHRETTVEFLASLAEVLVIVLFIMTFVLQNFEIPSGSMEDTLLVGDHVLVNREQFAPPTSWMKSLLPYRSVQRNDIAVFFSPEEQGLFLVKRIVGVPGDRLHLRDGDLYRNGVKLVEPYVQHKLANYDPYRDNFPAVAPYELRNERWKQELASHIDGEDVVVPPGYYFAMGDNRDNSYDSRFFGFVPRENVIGRPLFVYWSFITPEGQYLMRDPGSRIASLAQTVIHFFDRTRWSRTLKVVK